MATPKEVRQIAALLTEDPDILDEKVRLQDPSKMNCPSCGASAIDPIRGGVKTKCDHCDSPISWTGGVGGRKANRLACPNCGAPWEVGEGACKNCGKAGRPISGRS